MSPVSPSISSFNLCLITVGFVRTLRPKVLIFHCLATNDNLVLPCLSVMVHIHLNWCLEGCTEWRWMRCNLVPVLDRCVERERQAMFWHKWRIGRQTLRLPVTSWIWSASMLLFYFLVLISVLIIIWFFFYRTGFSITDWAIITYVSASSFTKAGLSLFFFSSSHHTWCDKSVVFCTTLLTSPPLGWGDYRCKSPLELLYLCLESMLWTARRDW